MGRPKGSMNKKTLEKMEKLAKAGKADFAKDLAPAAAKALAKFKAANGKAAKGKAPVKVTAKAPAAKAKPISIRAAKTPQVNAAAAGNASDAKGRLSAALNAVLDYLDAGTALMNVDELEGVGQIPAVIQNAVAVAAARQVETLTRLKSLATPAPAAPAFAEVVTEVPAAAAVLSSSSTNGTTSKAFEPEAEADAEM